MLQIEYWDQHEMLKKVSTMNHLSGHAQTFSASYQISRKFPIVCGGLQKHMLKNTCLNSQPIDDVFDLSASEE